MTIYFDMDGTIADLYGVENWLEMLENEETTPYAEAKAMLNLSQLARMLNTLQAGGVRIGIVSWLSKSGSKSYNEEVRITKKKWLATHMPSVFWDEMHIVKYGTPKHSVVKEKGGILFDDEEKNRDRWKGMAYSPEEIFEVLKNVKGLL